MAEVIDKCYEGAYIKELDIKKACDGLKKLVDGCCPDHVPDDKLGTDNMSAIVIHFNWNLQFFIIKSIKFIF